MSEDMMRALADGELASIAGGAEEEEPEKPMRWGYWINPDLCLACGLCCEICPIDCITENGRYYVIDEAQCVNCGACAGACPACAIEG